MHAADFTVLRGEALRATPYFAFLEDYPASFLPTLHARAIAGGPLDAGDYQAFKAEFLERLAALLPLDGLYLAMHGAMFVDGMEDAEGDWITAAREVVGPDCVIAASYDLHGNLTPRIMDAIDLFSAYRTAPHIDVEATMRRSVAMLVRALETGIRPMLVWAPIPVVLPGERTSTVVDPARRIYAVLPEIDAMDGVWDASMMVGYVWADEPRAAANAVLTGTDRAVLERQALRLAALWWDARDEFAFEDGTASMADCIARAMASTTRPVVLAESGDNPTGGGVGDRADMLRALLNAGATDTIFAGIADAVATDAAYAAGVGAALTLSVGATLDRSSRPAVVTGVVRFLHPTNTTSDRQAVLRIDGRLDLVVTARRRPFHFIADFTRLGLDPRTARIVAVKSGYLSPELAPLANPGLMALTKGVVDQDVANLVRKRKSRPTYPFDRDFSFRPTVLIGARSLR